MKIKGLDHFTINVLSMEESLHFYGEVLGLPFDGGVDMGDHFINYFRLPDGNRLELIMYYYDTKKIEVEKFDSKAVYRHMALEVSDIKEAYQELEGIQNIKLLTEVAYIENLQFTNFLIVDPNGVEIEFLER